MDTIHEGRRVLTEAEASLRKLMEQALKRQRYSEVQELASWAHAISRIGEIGATNDVVAPTKPMEQRDAELKERKPEKPGLSQTGNSESQYPRFEKENDKLVKVGWSKKNRQAYEHRAPIQAVQNVVRELVHKVPAGQLFAVDAFMPVMDSSNGGEIPAYQVYMTLAWLRELGVVAKKGRDGYMLQKGAMITSDFNRLWSQLKERGVVEGGNT